jgi:hypothetical protein
MFTGHLLTNGTIGETTNKTPGPNHAKSVSPALSPQRRQFVIFM